MPKTRKQRRISKMPINLKTWVKQSKLKAKQERKKAYLDAELDKVV